MLATSAASAWAPVDVYKRQVLDYDLDDLGRNAGPKARVERDFWSALRRDAIVLAGSQLDDLIENVR